MGQVNVGAVAVTGTGNVVPPVRFRATDAKHAAPSSLMNDCAGAVFGKKRFESRQYGLMQRVHTARQLMCVLG
jgi:hypothetical protein